MTRHDGFVKLSAVLCAIGFDTASAQTQRAAAPVFDMAVTFHADAPALEVEGQVIVPARNREVDTVELQIDRRMRGLAVSVVSPASLGPGTLSTKGRSAFVALASPAPAATAITLTFKYSIGANATRSFYVASDGALISGQSAFWYPMPSSHSRATGQLRFVMPAGFTVASTGRRVAAADAGGRVRFDVTDPTTFSFAAGRHQVYTSPGEPAVALHLLKARPKVDERLAIIRRILTALVDEFGRYPHPDLEVVEMPNGAMGGSGNGTSLEGFVAVSSDIVDRASVATLGHEISHQWWADSVFATGEAPILLTETMANYGALRTVEALYGEPAAAYARWFGFPDEDLMSGGRGHLSLARAGVDAPLAPPGDPSVAGNKGMLVHDLLSRTLGRERFKSVLRAFTRDHAFGDASWDDFVDAVRSADPDIAWFFDQWYARAAVPSWTVSWAQVGDEVRGTITQSPPYFRADVEVALQSAQRRELRTVRIDGPRTEFALRPGFPVVSLQVDPDYKVPHRSPDRAADVDIIFPLAQAVKAVRAGTRLPEALQVAFGQQPSDAHDFVLAAILGGEAFERGEWDTAQTHVDAALASRGQLAELLPGLYYTQALLAQRRGDRPTLERAARATIETASRMVLPSGWSLAARELLDQGTR